jgi:four helix bundle protein
MAESFRDLEVWRLSMDVAVHVDGLVYRFAREGSVLRYQMLKSSTSIPFNIAEGYRRRSNAAYINHLSIAMGSQGELDTQLELALLTRRLTRAEVDPVSAQNRRVGWLLFRLWESLGGRRQ